jgi:hypothetical protein
VVKFADRIRKKKPKMYCVEKSKMSRKASYKSEESTYTENLVAEQETDHGVATLLQIVLTHREEQQRADHEDLEQHNHDPNRLPTTLT